MTLRKFNREGMRRFDQFISAYLRGRPSSHPQELRESARLSSPILGTSYESLLEVSFNSRYDMARTLDELFLECKIEPDVLSADEFWAWLTMAFFERLHNALSNKDKPGEKPIWYPEQRWRRVYRHALYGPWRVFRLKKHRPELVEPLLAGKMMRPGEFYEQIVGRLNLLHSDGVLGAARSLYWDAENQILRRGHAGSVRRFAIVVQQISLTRDLIMISAEELIDILPAEFDRWK